MEALQRKTAVAEATDLKLKLETKTITQAITNALLWVAQRQAADGHWVGMMETNCCMEAQWILMAHVLGIKDDPKYPKVIKAILHEQREDGSWDVYNHAPQGDINTTVECYAALRSAGFDANDEPVRKAREWILQHGGLKKIRVFTKFWLALIGEWPWEHTPVVPPEMIRIPTWMPFNIYWFACWARATFVPLSIVSACRLVVPLAPESRMDELFPEGRNYFDYSMPRRLEGFWPEIFRTIDRFLHFYHHLPYKPGREGSIKQALEWIIRHQDSDGGWGGIQPPHVYGLLALFAEGYLLKHPVMATGLDAWNKHWSYEKNDGCCYIQACESPVWDTMLVMTGALDCGETFETFPNFRPALEYLLDKQIFTKGDWAEVVKGVECGGWAFERANTFYPDLDDTAVALTVLLRIRKIAPPEYHARIDFAVKRAEAWVRAMQSTNGGWGAFDKDNNRAVLTKIPFCDFGEVLDPPSADLTGHKLEALGLMGFGMEDPAVKRAVDYIMSEQEPDGPWFGRWGVNYLYGTALVLPGLRSIGFDMNDERTHRACRWVVARQNPDGGWGETCGSYMDDNLRGVGKSTASQTAWGLISLTAIGSHDYDDAIRRGVEYLIRTQQDGTWDEDVHTGCGFPGYGLGERIFAKDTKTLSQGRELARGFMLNYNMYRHHFPLQALGRARAHLAEVEHNS
ncbi:MAG: squalene--hopene cyclase [Verrucomicrobiales bacterium]|jgi:squalene-hopene/tetraprenyl-beta-curcumene cyclase|nr:squalene--hopene cyclase [Verrucomicrobiales bacterium]